MNSAIELTLEQLNVRLTKLLPLATSFSEVPAVFTIFPRRDHFSVAARW